MNLTLRRVLATSALERAIESAGGEYEAFGSTALEAEVRELGARALRISAAQLAEIAGLDQIEFLTVGFGLADPAFIESLPKLRGLYVDGWKGRLDFGRLPRLEWLAIGDARAADGLDGLLTHHPTLRSLDVVFYQGRDLRSIRELPALKRLRLKQSRVQTLDGLGGALALSELLIEYSPRLHSLSAIRDCERVQYLALGPARGVTDIADAGRLPALRFLNLLELASIDSLRPLAGHPSLELLFLPQDVKVGIEALAEMPMLRAIWGPPRVLAKAPSAIPIFQELARDDRWVREMRSLMTG